MHNDFRKWMQLVGLREGMFDALPSHQAVAEVDRLMNPKWGVMLVETLTRNASHPHRFDWPIEGDDIVYLEHIEASKLGKGYGSKMLNLLCKVCDKHKVSIYLDAVPFNSGLSYNALIAFYGNAGFKKYPAMQGFAQYPMLRIGKGGQPPRAKSSGDDD